MEREMTSHEMYTERQPVIVQREDVQPLLGISSYSLQQRMMMVSKSLSLKY